MGRLRRKQLIDELQDLPDLVVLAEDEAKVYLQAAAQAVWAPPGQTPQVRLDPRKDAACFYGTLNLRTGQEVVTRSDQMNSEATIVHLEAILATYPDQPILLCWDRAPWHTATKVRQFVHDHWQLEIVWFPVGAPDLNPQEHVWRHGRAAIEHNHAFPSLSAVADAFEAELHNRTFSSSFFTTYGGTFVCPDLE